MIGRNAGSTTLGFTNTGLGRSVLHNLNGIPGLEAGNNTCAGYASGISITTGNSNTALGAQSLNGPLTGNDNLGLGVNAGTNYTGAESFNILIANQGVNGESNTIRIGDSGNQNRCHIAAIFGVTVVGAAVLCDSTGLLGTVASSERFKEDIHSIKESTILNLRPVSFKYKAEKEKLTHYGLIAEEVEKVFPELVLYEQDKTTPHSIKYHEMDVLLLVEIQKLRKELDELKRTLIL